MIKDMNSIKQNSCRRYNPLLQEWVIVATNRVTRPWSGAETESTDVSSFGKCTSINPLAPNGIRSSGQVTPEYSSTYVFDNDFPSFTEFENDSEYGLSTPLFTQMPVKGVCRVICYHPDSNKPMALLNLQELEAIVEIWLAQFNELKLKYKWIQIFENRGSVVGSSNAHPHGQLWAGNFLPSLPTRKDASQKAYYKKYDKVMLVEYLEEEKKKKERIVFENEHWTILVPFWALWPFETMLLPNRHIRRMDEITKEEIKSLANILQKLYIKYDNIFKCVFPFSMGWLGAPTGDTTEDHHWQLHASFHPPLLRSATVPKFLAGYEMFSEPQRDISPEQAATILREQSLIHFMVARNQTQN